MPSGTDEAEPIAAAPADRLRSLGPLLLVTGLCLSVVGWLDVALMWIPTRFNTPEWEFGTAGATFNALALGTIGVALLAGAALAFGSRRWLRALAVGCWLVLAFVIGTLVLYLLTAPLAWKAGGAAAQPLLKRAFLKAGVYSVTYMATYAALGWMLWRSARAQPAGAVGRSRIWLSGVLGAFRRLRSVRLPG